jgi:NCAIR mutase (PurE)-related protein
MMDPNKSLKTLFEALYEKKTTPEKALQAFKFFPYEDLGFAKADTHRAFRTGFPEIIFCEGKTPKQVVSIAEKIYKVHGFVAASRISKIQMQALKKRFKKTREITEARIAVIGNPPRKPMKPGILVLSAGTSDIAVAEEAAVVAELMGNKVKRIYDVGAAGVHRLLHQKDEIEKSRILVVVAGMDGVLPTITAGLFGKPVIAVPTSIGYGANFKGMASLLTMLNACALGVAVVNIDNGLGAGYFAALLNQLGA